MDEMITFKITDKDREWEGKLKINEIQEHFCVAELESRDSKFNVVLSCYFDKYNMQEWCMAVPNWNFGCKVSQLEEYWNEEQIEKYIPNKVDRKSLTSGITEMFKIVEQYRVLRPEQNRMENKGNQEEMENAVDKFIKENVTNAALDTLDEIRKEHNIQHAIRQEEQFSSYINTFLTPGIGEQKYEDSLKEMKIELKEVFINITINFQYDKARFNKMCDRAEEEILKITGENKQEREKKPEERREDEYTSTKTYYIYNTYTDEYIGELKANSVLDAEFKAWDVFGTCTDDVSAFTEKQGKEPEQTKEGQKKEHKKPEIKRAVGRAR